VTTVRDVVEIQTLRKMFESKYGKEYVIEATSDATCSKWQVHWGNMAISCLMLTGSSYFSMLLSPMNLFSRISLPSFSMHSFDSQVNQNLIRCLLIEAPPPEDKLSLLSEIAQEHGVGPEHWDASAAARDMLPSHAAPPLIPMPLGVGPGVQPYGEGLMPPPVPSPPPPCAGYGGPSQQYSDANQAAAAAAHAANQAKAAADYAAQFAFQQAGLAPPQYDVSRVRWRETAQCTISFVWFSPIFCALGSVIVK